MNLLERPRPFEPSAFKKAKSKLFPGEKAFVEFLKVGREELQIDCAKDLILTLIQNRHFPPPSRLLFNLLDFESETIGKGNPDDFGYVSQDHFVHLINLYLLGIYLYSYHSGIHRQCRLFLNRVRNECAVELSNKSKRAAELVSSWNEYELFSEIWSYFVLYHDIGYPLEAIDPDDRKKKVKFLKPFRKIKKSYLKDLSLKSIANCITLDLLLNEEDSFQLQDYLSFSNEYYAYGTTEGLEQEIIPGLSTAKFSMAGEIISTVEMNALHREWGGALNFPRLRGYYALRIMSSLLPIENTCAVLENTENGRAVLLLIRSSSGSVAFSFQPPRNLPTSIRRKTIEALTEYAFIRGEPPMRGFGWEYFSRRARDLFDDTIKEIFGEKLDGYHELVTHIIDRIPFAVRLASTEIGPSEISKYIFDELNKQLGYVDDLEPGEDLSTSFELGASSFAVFADRFDEIGAKCFKEALKTAIRDGRVDPFRILTSSGTVEAARKFQKIVHDLASDAASRFENLLGPEVKKNVRYYRTTKTSHAIVRDCIDNQLGVISEESFNPFSKLSLEHDLEFLNLDNLGFTKSDIDEIDLKLKRINFPAFKELLARYKPPYSKKPGVDSNGKSYIDHGLASAVVAIAARALFRKCCERLYDNPGPNVQPGIKMLRLAFVVGSQEEDLSLSLGVNQLLRDAIASITIHNIYPDALDEEYRDFRTNVRKDPLSFLALLSDALQVWDRRLLLNQALADLPFVLSAYDFDLQITGSDILVSVSGEKLEIRKALNKYRDNLKTYLQGADRLIRLNLRER